METQQIIIAEVKLVYRTKVKASERLQIRFSKDAYDIFMESWDLDSIEHNEEFKLMLLANPIPKILCHPLPHFLTKPCTKLAPKDNHPVNSLCKCLIFFKIRPFLTTSKEDLKTFFIHL